MPGTDGTQYPNEKEPDGPASIHPGCHSGLEMAQIDGVDSNPQRLEERYIISLDSVRRRNQQVSRPGYVCGKPAGDREMATEVNLLTQIAVPGIAVRALPAGVSRLDDDAFPSTRSGRDDPTHLVPQHKRLPNPILADCAFLEPVQIRTAQTDRSHANKFLAGQWDRVGLGVEPDVTGAVEPKYVHAAHDSGGSLSSRWRNLESRRIVVGLGRGDT